MQEHLNPNPTDKKFVAIVAGATGATGRWIVGELFNNEKCTKVIALTRSDIKDVHKTFPSIDPNLQASKLVIHKVDFKKLSDSGEFMPRLPASPSVGFCAMGSAPYSEESDFTLPVAFAKTCKTAGVESMFVVSASNASAGSWFGYMDTIGRREEAFKSVGFKRLGIFRPAMIDRQELRRPKEMLGYLLPSCWKIDSRVMAKSMVECAVRMKEGIHVFSNSDMKEIVKE